MSLKYKTAVCRWLQKRWKQLKSLPVSLRVTLWYTLFLSIILLLFTGVILKMGADYEKRTATRTLTKAVEVRLRALSTELNHGKRGQIPGL